MDSRSKNSSTRFEIGWWPHDRNFFKLPGVWNCSISSLFHLSTAWICFKLWDLLVIPWEIFPITSFIHKSSSSSLSSAPLSSSCLPSDSRASYSTFVNSMTSLGRLVDCSFDFSSCFYPIEYWFFASNSCYNFSYSFFLSSSAIICSCSCCFVLFSSSYFWSFSSCNLFSKSSFSLWFCKSIFTFYSSIAFLLASNYFWVDFSSYFILSSSFACLWDSFSHYNLICSSWKRFNYTSSLNIFFSNLLDSSTSHSTLLATNLFCISSICSSMDRF